MLRFESLIGNAAADGWVEPARHQSGLEFRRTCDVIQTRPLSPIIGLWVMVWLFQIALKPQLGEKPCSRAATFGVAGGSTGILASQSAGPAEPSIGMQAPRSAVAQHISR